MTKKPKFIDHYGYDSFPAYEAVAKAKSADVFCTTNEEMLKHRKSLEKEYGLKLMHPKELTK